MMVNLRLALIAVVLFGSVWYMSGRIREANGLGYDGVEYAQMVRDGLDAGFPNARLRPLILLVNRAVYRGFGTDMIETFVWTNFLFMFLLALGLALLMDRYAASEQVKAVFVANMALCISTAQMFAYYPVLVDLGALAAVVLAVYCVIAAPAWLAAVAAVAAVASREFGIVVVLFGIHRELRLRRWLRAGLTYIPAALVFVAIRRYVQATTPLDLDAEMLAVPDLLRNARLWLNPPFPFFFVYFFVTVFGGLSAFLLMQPRRVAAFVRQEHELLSLMIPMLGLAALGSADIWRYLVYLLPAAAVLFAAATRDVPRFRLSLIVITLVTIATQRPWREISVAVYFTHWFPYYAWRTSQGPLPGTLIEWAARATVAVVGLVLLRAAILTDRRATQPTYSRVVNGDT